MAGETWTIKRCLDWTIDYLGKKGVERARLSAEWLLTSVTGLSRVNLYTSFDKPLSPDELAAMHEAVVRRAKGEPLQYISGETSFRTIDVACEPGVLIPRPETEVLVEEVLTYLDREVLDGGANGSSARKRVALPWNAEVEAAIREEEAARAEAAEKGGDGTAEESLESVTDETSEVDGGTGSDGTPEVDGTADGGEAPEGAEDERPRAPRVARVLEVGCGTGCISLSIAAERKGHAVCVATDIEPRAVALACRNRDALGIESDVVDIREGNLVSPLDRQREWGSFDALVSNPPYIPSSVMKRLPHEVADFEPALALDGGADGLDIFRRLLRAAPHMLRPGGLFACELFEGAVDAAAALCRDAGLEDVRVVRDLTDRPRIVAAIVPEALARAAAEQDGRALSS